jgi:hypothetical protein
MAFDRILTETDWLKANTGNCGSVSGLMCLLQFTRCRSMGSSRSGRSVHDYQRGDSVSSEPKTFGGADTTDAARQARPQTEVRSFVAPWQDWVRIAECAPLMIAPALRDH